MAENPVDHDVNKQNDQMDQERVKSNAVVKYSAPKPATFAKLQCNTDLNLPPSNWLSSSADSYGLQRVIHHQKGLSSFRMAHMYPDCVGEVDVVSDAENIKNLLKIPYSKGHVSMMVHRVENTLLLDEFDIYKHLLKTSETEWEWLNKFFTENVDRETYEQDRHLYLKNRTQKALKQKSLVSKFLYHSLVEGEETEQSDLRPYPLQTNSLQTPPLPDPSPNTHDRSFEFNRNVVWTFEDIEMLLGTDMPIFGGGTHPCISLRLRDMNKPISVLTGIDYWLDNLMSNVPEVVMCYHLNGIVQKYELIKTEDLPRLDNSKFSPKLIRDVAQSILSFLKSNATKAGHTYWLFKGKDEEVVKLYDLTSLCSEEDVQKGQNPFTIPVAMLLYRVARNMKNNPDRRSQPGTIRMLLKNTVKLLPEEKYPEIVTSSHYMLSDLYIPAALNPEKPNLEEFDKEDDEQSVYDDDEDMGNTISVLDLEKQRDVENSRSSYKAPGPISGSLEERCIQAIGHVGAGLNCLQFFSEDSDEKHKNNEEVPMAKPFEPIPMPYGKLSDKNVNLKSTKRSKKKDKKKKDKEEQKMALLPKDPNDAAYHPKWPSFDPNSISWKGHLKTLMLEKAVLVYATLAEYYIGQARYGECLRVLGLLARCQLALDRTQPLSGGGALRLSCLLGRAGDACLMIVQHWKNVDSYREQLHSQLDEDVRLLEKLEQDERASMVNLGDSDTKVVFVHDIRTIEQMLVKTVQCYEGAQKMSPSESISFRLANSLNELASFYLNVAKNEKCPKDIIDACQKGEPYLVRGLQIFEKLNNDANIALLNSNMGHLHRLLAYAHTPEERTELTHLERKHYTKAFHSYKRALRVIGDRKNCPGIWDAVTWELSTVLFTVSNIVYENPPADASKADAEKQALEALQAAVDHCDLNESNPKFPLYQYRAATLYFRMASLWHGHVWDAQTDSRRLAVQLAQINYEKAVKLFYMSGDALSYITGQMQRVALNEYLVEGATSSLVKHKHLRTCVQIFIDINDMLRLLIDKKVEVQEIKPEDDKSSFKTLSSLLKLVKLRLQHVLKMLVKICLTSSSKLLEYYKKCYKATLELSDDLDVNQLLGALHNTLKEIGQLDHCVEY